MNGAESLMETLLGCGVDTCFMNPGTSEMHFVAALDHAPAMRPVLGLFEGVVTGMADGYGRIAERPAATLLHLGPGLANGLANLHNARRASTPIVNIVGDHATHHRQYDAPLSSDVVGFARPVSGWIHEATDSATLAADTARAVAAASAPGGQIATLILPADVAWGEAHGAAAPIAPGAPTAVTAATIDRIAGSIGAARSPALLLRGPALLDRGLAAAARIATATGATLLADTFAPRQRRGRGVPAVTSVPYFAEQIVEFLSAFDLLILVGSRPPVSFFAYPGKPSWCVPAHTRLDYLAQPHEDGVEALEMLADRFPNAPGGDGPSSVATTPSFDADRLDQFAVGAIVGQHLPENAIISEEAATNAAGVAIGTRSAAPHDYLRLTGGSIGQALPVATGAAIARPDAKVVCLSGDGGAMYTVQALWTQARERLDVTTVIFANNSYGILNVEMARMGFSAPGPGARAMLDLHDPVIDWQAVGRSMGVEASRATTVAQFDSQFADAMRHPGPRLIEVVL